MIPLILLQSDAFWSNLPATIGAIGSFVVLCITALISWGTYKRAGKAKEEAVIAKGEAIIAKDAAISAESVGNENKIKLEDIGKKVDGQLTELLNLMREKYIAQGEASERAKHAKQQADENVGKLKAHEENKNTVKEVKEIKEVIVKTVEDKADETQKKVDEVPDKTAEEVVKKINPKKR